jgi:chromosome segregation ATPase
MARKQSWNPGKLNAELSASDEAINPLLASANIASIKVNGADVPASEAPLQDRIKALGDVTKAGAKSADAVELATLNGQITAQLEKAESELAVAKSSVATLTQEKSTLSAELSTATASVSKLTADNAELGNRNTTLAKELETSAGKINSTNAEISKQCIAVNCLTLTDGEGKPLAKDATEAQKIEAANKVPVAEKITALMGAIHSSAASIGVDLKKVPAVAGVAAPDNGKKLSADAQIAKALAGKK